MNPRSQSSRPGSSPIRDTPRTRAAARRVERVSKLNRHVQEQSVADPEFVTTEDLTPDSIPATVANKRVSRTARLWVIIIVAAILVWSFGTSIRIYIQQERDMNQARIEIAQTQQRIDVLNDEISRWENPDYVRAQARTRLGWVIPGETGYRVIGKDGTVIGRSVEIDSSGRLPTGEANEDWSDSLLMSVKIADQPVSEEDNNVPVSVGPDGVIDEGP